MLLSARFLSDCSDVNNFSYADQLEFSQGSATSVFFILTDVQKDRIAQGFVPAGRRYVPGAASTLSASLSSGDLNNDPIVRQCTPPFPTQDLSIWEIEIMSTDTFSGCVNVTLTLTDGVTNVISTGTIQCAFRVVGGDTGDCC
jgi:hypothetical protein